MKNHRRQLQVTFITLCVCFFLLLLQRVRLLGIGKGEGGGAAHKGGRSCLDGWMDGNFCAQTPREKHR